MECLKLFHELSMMSKRMNIPILEHWFKSFDPDEDMNLIAVITHFASIKSLNAADYRSAYHQLCDFFYGWNVTDGVDYYSADIAASEHFKMARFPREIDMKERGEQLEVERIMKTFETLFSLTRRALKKIHLEIEEEISNIGNGLGTMISGKDNRNDYEDEVDKEDLWRQKGDDTAPRDELDEIDDLDLDLDDDDDLGHFASVERRISRVSDGMVVRKKSTVGAISGNQIQTSRPPAMSTMKEDDEEGDENNDRKSEISNQSSRSSAVADPSAAADGSPSEKASQPTDTPPVKESRRESASISARRESVAGSNTRRASTLPKDGFNFQMKTAKGVLKQDTDEMMKLVHNDINQIYGEIDRSVDLLLICLSNIILVMAFSELLDHAENYEKFNHYAHELSAEFVSYTLKIVWDLLNRELPGQMTLEQLRNPDLLKARLRDVVNLRTDKTKTARLHRIKKLSKKFILVHELFYAFDIHVFPNFIAAHREGIRCCQYSVFDSSLWLSGGYDCIIRIHDLRASNSHTCLAQYVGHKSIVTDVKFAKDDTVVVSSSFDRTIKIWNAQSAACERTLVGHTDSVLSCDVSPDGRYVASGSTDCTVRTWDLATGDCLSVAKKHSKWVKVVRFTLDGRYVLSAGLDHKIYVWDIKILTNSRTVSHSRCIEAHADYILDMAVSRPSFVLTTSRDATVRLHDYTTGHEHYCISLAPSWACTVAFSADGEYFATGSFDNNVIIFNSKEGTRVREIRVLNLGIMCVRFPRDLEYIVVGTVEGFLQQITL